MKETLKALREQFNYSQNSVAQFLGVSRQMYIKYESGEVEPPVKVVVALAGLYKVPYDVLLENKVHKEVTYGFSEEKTLTFSDSGTCYSDGTNMEELQEKYSPEKVYQECIVNLFSKLNYLEQIQVYSEMAGIIQKHGEEIAGTILEAKRERDPLQDFFELGDKLHGHSNGWKWNREELYDREICRHRGE